MREIRSEDDSARAETAASDASRRPATSPPWSCRSRVPDPPPRWAAVEVCYALSPRQAGSVARTDTAGWFHRVGSSVVRGW